MDPFLVNINDPEGERYAKVQLQLSVVPESAVGDISGDPLVMAQMRDRVLTLLSAKSFQELSSPIGKEGVRREIKSRLDPLLEKGEIQEVLFQDFLVQ
jgi:flagellar FliL protein